MILNEHDIFPLPIGERVIIPIQNNNPKIVLTDGYHYTKPLELVYHHYKVYHFKVVCVVDDFQLVAGFAIMIIFYILGLLTGFIFIQFLSLAPILYFLFFYYVNRNDFLQVRPS